jgi:hypothetical protein
LIPIALVVILVIVGGSFLASTESGKRLLRNPAERTAYENGIESGTIAGGAYYIKDYLNKHPDVPRARDWEELSRCEGKIDCPKDPKLVVASPHPITRKNRELRIDVPPGSPHRAGLP